MTTSLDAALRLKREGDLQGALLALEGVLDAAPSHPLALAHLAEVQLRRGRLGEAGAALERAEQAGGSSAFTARLRGDLAYRRRRYAEAARAYQEADALGEKGTWSLLRLGRCQLHLGDLASARGAAAAAAEREPGSAAPWSLLGEVAAKSGAGEEAEAMFSRAHERDPQDKWAHAKLVEARLARLDPELRDREIAVLMKSTGRSNEHLVEVLARSRAGRGATAEAAEAWDRRVQLRGDLRSRKMRGYALRKAGRLDEAASVIAAALLDDPEDLILFRTYLHLQRQRGATEELRATLEQLAPRAGERRGAVYGELRKLGPPPGQG